MFESCVNTVDIKINVSLVLKIELFQDLSSNYELDRDYNFSFYSVPMHSRSANQMLALWILCVFLRDIRMEQKGFGKISLIIKVLAIKARGHNFRLPFPHKMR